MQFTYQFPHLVQRLILVAPGGVTKDVNIVLRCASLPFVGDALGLLRLPLAGPLLRLGASTARATLGRVGLAGDIPDVLRVVADLPEPAASAAFTKTLRAVVDWRGQVVTMLDRCYLTESIPVQLIWGNDDLVIPVSHGRLAHSAMPGSRLEIFERSGHFPFHDDPARFVEIVRDFISSTEPADYGDEELRRLLRTGVTEQTISGGAQTRMAVLDAMGTDERSAT
jgi:pimeloyl-ACP methyl ester carboxylesterase